MEITAEANPFNIFLKVAEWRGMNSKEYEMPKLEIQIF